MKAALYCRVSTEEQGNKGYSLRQQLEALREYCQQNKYEIVGEFEDRASGASLDRLGLDALRDAVSAGGVDVVLAQDRDRLSREPAHVYILREEFLGYGTTLRALNDRGDDSPEGELYDAIFDQLAKFERAKTLERTRRGKLMKARSGKIVGNGKAPYGFLYEDDHYHVDPERMPFVHMIFEKLAEGCSLYSVVQHLHDIGAPTPGSGRWHESTLRSIVKNDTYLGTAFYGKNRITTTTVSKLEDGKKTYKRKVVTERRPESEWIAIPVPDSGISPEIVARARESLKGNVKSVSKNDGRVWELSGGVAVCSECGRRMGAYTTLNSRRKRYHYYRCSNRESNACSNRKHRPARDLEMWVKDALQEAFHPEAWESFVDDLCDRKLEDLRKLRRSDPSKTKENLLNCITSLEARLGRARDLFIVGDLTRPEYEEKRDQIQDEIEVIRGELTKVDDLDTEIRRVEDLRKTLLSIEDPLSGHYAFLIDEDNAEAVGESKDNLPYGFGYGSKETAAWRRQEFYRKVGLRVRVGEQGLEISLGIGEPIVSKLGTASVSSSGSTSYLPSSATSLA
jgi:site-specific DNA recombinase